MICWTTSSSGIGDDSYASRSSSMKAISLYEVPYFLPGEGGLTTGAHEVRRRNVPLAGVMGLATHELIVKLVPEADSIKTIFMRLSMSSMLTSATAKAKSRSGGTFSCEGA